MGVWIETGQHMSNDMQRYVTPFVGVWIETVINPQPIMMFSVTPFVGVWIETLYTYCYNLAIQSHPSWVCGLKPNDDKEFNAIYLSHPSWVCGLKHFQPYQ